MAKNETLAFQNIQKASKAGSLLGNFILATYYYYYGKGVPRDPEKAMQELSSIEAVWPGGFAAYYKGLIELYDRKNSERGLYYLARAANDDIDRAQWEIGAFYYFDGHNPL